MAEQASWPTYTFDFILIGSNWRGTAAEIQMQKQSKYSCTDSNPLYYLIVGSLEHWHLAMLVAPGILSEHRNEEYGKKQIQI